MATEVVMPKLGLTMERGTVGAWLVSEGEEVAKGSPLLEVVTDKVTMEVESQVSGVLRKILVEAGVEVQVATPIGIIGDADDSQPQRSAEVSLAPTPATPQDRTGDWRAEVEGLRQELEEVRRRLSLLERQRVSE